MYEDSYLDSSWEDRFESMYEEQEGYDDGSYYGPDDYSDDADALASAGWGTDEDYGGVNEYEPDCDDGCYD